MGNVPTVVQGAYRTPEAAAYLGIAERSLAREYASGKIVPRRFGRILLYPRDELDRWLAELPEAKPSDVATPERHPAQQKGGAE